MPKITNYTTEEKAEKFLKLRKTSAGLTVEERADKWDEYVIYKSKKNMEYASRNKEKVAEISAQHYIKNKLQYDTNRMKKYYNSKKNSTEL